MSYSGKRMLLKLGIEPPSLAFGEPAPKNRRNNISKSKENERNIMESNEGFSSDSKAHRRDIPPLIQAPRARPALKIIEYERGLPSPCPSLAESVEDYCAEYGYPWEPPALVTPPIISEFHRSKIHHSRVRGFSVSPRRENSEDAVARRCLFGVDVLHEEPEPEPEPLVGRETENEQCLDRQPETDHSVPHKDPLPVTKLVPYDSSSNSELSMTPPSHLVTQLSCEPAPINERNNISELNENGMNNITESNEAQHPTPSSNHGLSRNFASVATWMKDGRLQVYVQSSEDEEDVDDPTGPAFSASPPLTTEAPPSEDPASGALVQPTDSSPTQRNNEDAIPTQLQTAENEDYEVPTSTRKRVAHPEKRKTHVAKMAYNAGKAHVTSRNKQREARHLRKPCKNECHRCQKVQRLTEEQRKEIFEQFWMIGNHDLQLQFILRHITVISPKKKKQNARNKTNTRKYFFRLGKEEYPVCKTMFLSTLCICDSWVDTAIRNTSSCGYVASDGRGKHNNRPRRTSPEKIKLIREHIDSFQRVPSHYTRKRSKRQYLDPNLSIRQMYRMFRIWTEKVKKMPTEGLPSEKQYRYIFNTHYNLGFFQPRKDQCATCSKYKAAAFAEKERLKPMMVRHLTNKQRSKELIEAYNEEGKSNEKLFVGSFDLQKVLACPKSEVSVFFYRNKASILNFTIFDQVNNVGYCYLWDERTAKRGSNDIASYLFDFIEKKVREGFTEFRFFSDSCSGQNKNRIVYSMLLVAAQKFGVKIRLVFLEPGHTQMEVDSMHARIEKYTKRREIFSKAEWVSAIEEAKQTGQTYLVHQVNREEIFDFKELQGKLQWEHTFEKVNGVEKKTKISWVRVKVVDVDETSDEVRFRYSYDGVIRSTHVKKRGRNVNFETYPLKAAYTSRLPLKEKKKRDIIFLCEKGAIPSKYHQEYSDFLGCPVGAVKNPRWLPAPDMDEAAFADDAPEGENPAEESSDGEIDAADNDPGQGEVAENDLPEFDSAEDGPLPDFDVDQYFRQQEQQENARREDECLSEDEELIPGDEELMPGDEERILDD